MRKTRFTHGKAGPNFEDMTRIAVVTGANQGIGHALVSDLAHRWDKDDLVLLTGRNSGRVADAVAEIAPGAVARVEGRPLDVTDPDAVARLAAELGAVDVVLSNAAARLVRDRTQAEQADEFLAVANGGAHAMLRSFGPILRPGGRLIVVASSLGVLGNLDERLHPLFDGVTLDQVEAAVEEYRKAVHDGTAEAKGWPEWVNFPSKIAQVAAVRAVAARRRETDLREGTLVAAVCPGLVDTAASRPWFADFSDAATPAQAAKTLLDFILAPLDPATYGELVRDGEVVPWRAETASRRNLTA